MLGSWEGEKVKAKLAERNRRSKEKIYRRDRRGRREKNKGDSTSWARIMKKSAAISRGGPGPFQGPSSYPLLCCWSLI